MSVIRILPENLANQIAAGEVVERPASVVKELLENAVDSGAKNISVQVAGEAIDLIRVSDDGSGMDGDDLLLCLARHATSKITNAAELAAIKTLGFRGEALASIASVSSLTISSRLAGLELGGRVEARFGAVGKMLEAGAAIGTTVEVRDLFANVPARRKFLKGARTELHHVEDCVKNCGLAFPALGLHYQVDDRTVLHWPAGVDGVVERARRLLRSATRRSMIEVGAAKLALLAKDSEQDLSSPLVFGLLLAPEDVPATGGRLRIFVNNRPIRDRMIAHAVAEGLQQQLLRGRQPAGVIFIRVAPATVDVNVHPAKQEVRFQRPALICDTVREAVIEGLINHERERGRALLGASNEIAAAEAPRSSPKRMDLFSGDYRGEKMNLAPPSHYGLGRSASVSQVCERELDFFATTPGLTQTETNLAAATVAKTAASALTGTSAGGSAPVGQEAGAPLVEKVSAPPRLLGQVLRSYIICAVDDGLLAVDQHAAHERLIYQRLSDQYKENGLSRQTLLFPAVLECSPAEAEVLETRAAEIRLLGLDIEAFGGLSYLVKAVPALLANHNPADVVAGVISRFLVGGDERLSASRPRLEAILVGMACQAAVKAGQALAEVEMQGLLNEMQLAGIFSRCPHGRPVFRHIGAEEMKKWFNR